MKKTAALAAGLVLLGCGTARAPGKPRIALVMKSLANEFFKTMEDGARAHQQANAAEYELLASGIKDEQDVAGQVRLVEQVIADRVSALGHRVHNGWLVIRAGSVERRRDCLATAGIISWTVRQSPFQRRAKVATLVAATAAGIKRYPLIDVPEDLVWAVAAEASPWVADSIWAVR